MKTDIFITDYIRFFLNKSQGIIAQALNNFK